MKFLVDECCNAGLVVELRAAGHDVRYVAEEAAAAAGASDDAVLERASAEGRILVTEDKDFGELVIRHGKPVLGIVLLRIDPTRRGCKALRLRTLIDRFGDRLVGHDAVVQADRFRFRRLGPPG